MNAMLQKVALALKAAHYDLHAVVKRNVQDKTWEVWVEGKAAEVNFKNHSDAFARCETLNYEYAARKAVEAIADYNFSHGDRAVLEFLDTFIKYAR